MSRAIGRERAVVFANIHAGLVLAYTIYYISQSPSAQENLRAEFLSVTPTMQAPTPFPSTSSIASEHEDTTSGLSQDIPLPSPASLDRLPYLSAVLKESLRMRPNSTPLPRITPDHPVTLAGIEGIPPGTRVNAFQWLVHRDPNTFAQPDLWNPDRWQRGEGKGSGGSEVGELWAFASGPRMCVGSHFTHYGRSTSRGYTFSRLSCSNGHVSSV
jgi:cytochrome P450